MGGNNEFFENFEKNKYLKKLPSMQRVNLSIPTSSWISNLGSRVSVTYKRANCSGLPVF